MLINQQIGPFIIEAELGSGAMGTVYRALFTKTGQKVALKVVSIGAMNESSLARFEREAEILKQLRHPNIVRWIGTGRYKGTPFIAMEFIEGDTLDNVLAERGRFSWEEVVRLGKQLCDALQHAHERGIIHRDLKPPNLMLTHDGVLKLTDFGIAKDTDSATLTAANCTVGTAAYMSPEQCRGERYLTAKSDLYSLGIVLYELLTGTKPFQAESPIEMFLLHVEGEFVRPGRVVMGLPIWLDNLVCQLMEKKPEHRPYDAATVARSLTEVMERMAAQQSAGADVAATSVVDRPKRSGPISEEDREAARLIKAGKKKKARKDVTVPVYRQGWFVALAALALLTAVGGGVWVVLRPPPPDTLYAQIEGLIQADQWDEAEPLLQRYLAAANRRRESPERVAQAESWQQRLLAGRREKQLHKRYASTLKLGAGEEGFKEGIAALTAEDDGDLTRARQRWQALREQFAGQADPELAVWAWLASKKLSDLDGIAPLEQRLLRENDEDRIDGRQRPSVSEAEQAARLALRLERFGDLTLARDQWRKLADELQKTLDHRSWLLLAAHKARESARAAPRVEADKERMARLEMVRSRLSEALTLIADEDPRHRRRGQLTLQDIHWLYRDEADPDLRAEADRAGQRLPKNP